MISLYRAATSHAASPSFLPVRTGCILSELSPVTVDDVIAIIRKLPDKQCSTDILPTSLLKKCADELAPFLTYLFNRSLSDGVVPASFKSAFITPRLKKPGLDAAEACSHRPISNLSVISKMLERLVAIRLLAYLDESGLMPTMQSAYRRNHSTETAVLRVLSDILLALDRGDFAAVALLDLSAAFDTVDHDTHSSSTCLVRPAWPCFKLVSFIPAGPCTTRAVCCHQVVSVNCLIQRTAGICTGPHSIFAIYS